MPTRILLALLEEQFQTHLQEVQGYESDRVGTQYSLASNDDYSAIPAATETTIVWHDRPDTVSPIEPLLLDPKDIAREQDQKRQIEKWLIFFRNSLHQSTPALINEVRGRKVPTGSGESTPLPGNHQGDAGETTRQTPASPSRQTNLPLNARTSGGREGGDNPPEAVHTEDNHCPLCNGGPCVERPCDVTVPSASNPENTREYRFLGSGWSLELIKHYLKYRSEPPGFKLFAKLSGHETSKYLNYVLGDDFYNEIIKDDLKKGDKYFYWLQNAYKEEQGEHSAAQLLLSFFTPYDQQLPEIQRLIKDPCNGSYGFMHYVYDLLRKNPIAPEYLDDVEDMYRGNMFELKYMFYENITPEEIESCNEFESVKNKERFFDYLYTYLNENMGMLKTRVSSLEYGDELIAQLKAVFSDYDDKKEKLWFNTLSFAQYISDRKSTPTNDRLHQGIKRLNDFFNDLSAAVSITRKNPTLFYAISRYPEQYEDVLDDLKNWEYEEKIKEQKKQKRKQRKIEKRKNRKMSTDF